MYADIPLPLSLVLLVGGLGALAWSSDVFVAGAAAMARLSGVSSFVIGMVIIGFGTSLPELCVSTMSALSGHADLSLGNAYGSNIFNIEMILGIAALACPIVVAPSVAFAAGPGLAGVSLLSWWILGDGTCSRLEAGLLLATFAVILPLYCRRYRRTGTCPERRMQDGNGERPCLRLALVQVVGGLALVICSSHLLVWGAVDFARFMHASDLLIGLTIVAAGTSLPELASAIASARRGEHEFVLGNIVGSNLFNTLAVVGLATLISPLAPAPGGAPAFSRGILTRDIPLMAALSLSIAFFGINWRHPGRPGVILRWKGCAWICIFVAYTLLMFHQETH
ncbi:MAG: calcium/sodium antiporter [Kiritimatiellia bacterium]